MGALPPVRRDGANAQGGRARCQTRRSRTDSPRGRSMPVPAPIRPPARGRSRSMSPTALCSTPPSRPPTSSTCAAPGSPGRAARTTGSPANGPITTVASSPNASRAIPSPWPAACSACATSGLVAPALAGLWLRAPAAVRKSRAQLAAILATTLGWSATIVALGLHQRTMRAVGHGIPLVSVDYFGFVAKDFHVLWTIWIATTFGLLALIVVLADVVHAVVRQCLDRRPHPPSRRGLVEHPAAATARAGRDDRGGRGR